MFKKFVLLVGVFLSLVAEEEVVILHQRRFQKIPRILKK